MKNQKIWPHWDHCLTATMISNYIVPSWGHALATLPNTPWPWNARGLACLALAHACSFAPAGIEFLALSSTTHIYTSEAFREPVPHYSASQLCIHPSLWSLEGASGMKVILKHQLPLPHDRSHHESTLRGASHSTWVSKELDHLSAWKGSRWPTEYHKLLS